MISVKWTKIQISYLKKAYYTVYLIIE